MSDTVLALYHGRWVEAQTTYHPRLFFIDGLPIHRKRINAIRSRVIN